MCSSEWVRCFFDNEISALCDLFVVSEISWSAVCSSCYLEVFAFFQLFFKTLRSSLSWRMPPKKAPGKLSFCFCVQRNTCQGF